MKSMRSNIVNFNNISNSGKEVKKHKTWYERLFNIYVVVVYLTTGPCSVSKSWGGYVLDSDSDTSAPSLCC